MDQKLIEFNKNQQRQDIPHIQPGDIVRVHKKIKEGQKERVQVFKGLVISIKGKQSSSPTVTVRRESQGIGTEMTFPTNLPTVEKIEVLRHSKIRRSKLYYMRERSGKSAKMKVKEQSEEEKKLMKKEGQPTEKAVEEKNNKEEDKK
ncbi:MAG: 50S ribosomal protein L19 [Candidatus Moranbacteria bacterium]|nr:50S ribosomal protein L19 [Candidatus Moranbacteria bacterium]